MTYKTEMTKSAYNGWNAVTEIILKEISTTENLIFKVTTCKKSTNASALIREYDNGFTVDKFTVFQDYSERVCLSDVKRATEKSVREAHERALLLIEPHLVAVKKQYDIA